MRTLVVITGIGLICLALSGRAALAEPPKVELQETASTAYMPKGAVLSPDGKLFYVANFGALNARNVTIYDAATLAPQGQIDLPGVAVEVMFSPTDANVLFVSNFNRDSVQYVDVRTKQVTKEVRLKQYARPKTMAVSADGRTLFTANWAYDDVAQIDVAQGRVVRYLQTGKNPRGIAITRSGTLYVANFSEKSIDVFGGKDFRKLKRIPACEIPRHLVISPDQRTLYISCYRRWQLQAMDLATDEVLHKVSIGASPKSIEVSRDGRWVWSADYGVTSTVSVVDTVDWTARVYPVPSMDRGSGIAVSADGKHALVTGWYDSHVYLVGFEGTGGHPREALQATKEWNYGHRPDASP